MVSTGILIRAKTWVRSKGALLVASGWPFPNAWVHPGSEAALRARMGDGMDRTRWADERGYALREVREKIMFMPTIAQMIKFDLIFLHVKGRIL